MSALRLLPVLLAPALVGCVGITAAEVGPAVATAHARESAVAADAYLGFGTPFGESGGGIGVGPELRAKIGPNLGQAALGLFLFAMGGAPRKNRFPFVPFGRLGMSVFQYERVDVATSSGFGGVHASGGLLIPLHADHGITITIGAEYDVRHGNLADTGFLSLMVGYGAYLAEPLPPDPPNPTPPPRAP